MENINDEKVQYPKCCFNYCCICRYSIMNSGGFHGKTFLNKLTGKTHFYCVNCYPKAIEIYCADLKLSQVEKEFNPPSHER